jgi:glycosyltransferase involved in cell wall biosynthesis
MKLAIISSGAAGTAKLFLPFYTALAAHPEIELLVLEQVPQQQSVANCGFKTLPLNFRVEPIPCRFFDRGHAAKNVMSCRFAQLLVEFEPEVVYFLGEAGYLSAFQTVRLLRQRLPQAKLCIYAAQNIYQKFPFPFPAIESYVLKNTSLAFPIGQEHEEVIRKKGYCGPTQHLPLGVDTDFFTPQIAPTRIPFTDKPDIVIGFVGRLIPVKRVHLLIEAVNRLKQKAGLVIIGDGLERQNLVNLVNQFNLAARAIFTGNVPHTALPAYLHAMDMIVLPSGHTTNRVLHLFRIASKEQFGRVLIEAMACGKPVVGSSSGEIPTVIGDAGLVFAEDDVAALTATLDRLCVDAVLREELGRKGRARALAQYDWRVVTERFISAILSINH